MKPDLLFKDGQPQGFSTLAVTQWDGHPEPVVRELLQNCLDAAVAAKRCTAEVHFTIRDIPPSDIPGIGSYREHFEEAVRQREGDKQGVVERQVIERIRKVLDAARVRILCCRDNGVGLNSERMGRVLTEGNTDKSGKGAGAFGIGHLTAFAASDLRYVLYAGRSSRGNDIASAHAILASRALKGGGGRGGHGHWLRGDDATLFDPSPYPDWAPPLLERELDRMEDTGSVVCIAGFNDFRDPDKDPVEAIARVAAKNFLVAIWRGRMVVRVQGIAGSEIVVDRERLRSVLEPGRMKKRGEQSGGDWLPGAQAYRAWQTLEEGEEFTLRAGAQVRFRHLQKSRGKRRSRVQVFRDGMWITQKADALQPWHFNGFNPFDAVIMVEDGKAERSELCRLVRGAEGPEHRGLARKRLSPPDNRKLLKRLQRIRDELRSKSGEVERDDEFEPVGFAVITGRKQRVAEVMRTYRPRRPPGNERKATELQPDRKSEIGIDPPRGNSGNTRRRKGRGASPRPGRGVPGRQTVLAVRNGKGTVDEVRVAWRPGGRTGANSAFGVRVRVPSGSDATCNLPLPPEWLRIREILHEGGFAAPPDGDPFEVALPADSREFTVFLGDSASDPNAIEVDIVGRRVDPPSQPAPETPARA